MGVLGLWALSVFHHVTLCTPSLDTEFPPT
jgi:hypothetical protein